MLLHDPLDYGQTQAGAGGFGGVEGLAQVGQVLWGNAGAGVGDGADEGTFPNFQQLQTVDEDSSLDASISWDLGELIWNNDQTSIDVRSKLMVELRDDIVDEVTRAYFDRRRLQVELMTQPPADPHTQIDKELQLQELTARLDGLTGGYFSSHTGIHE